MDAQNEFIDEHCEPAHLECVFSGGFIVGGLKCFVLWNGSFGSFPRYVWFRITFDPDPKNHRFPWKTYVFKVTKSTHIIHPRSGEGHPPSSTVTGAGLPMKSGVLLPSGMLVTYCVMMTPGSLDLFFMMAETIRDICWLLLSPKNGQKQKHKYSSCFWWSGMVCFCYQQRSGLSHISCDAH